MQTIIPTPEVSVIVPARNEEVCLADCLRTLVGQSGASYEVIVVDDHSTDANTGDWGEFYLSHPFAKDAKGWGTRTTSQQMRGRARLFPPCRQSRATRAGHPHTKMVRPGFA